MVLGTIEPRGGASVAVSGLVLLDGSVASGRDSDLAKSFAVRSMAESVVNRRASCSHTLSVAALPRSVSPAKQKSK